MMKRDALLDCRLTERLCQKAGIPSKIRKINGLGRFPLLDCCLTGVGVATAGMGPSGIGSAAHREGLDGRGGRATEAGHEINFNRVFFQYQQPRPLAEIDAELAEVENRILALLREVTE